MDKGDIQFGLVIAAIFGGGAAALFGLVYGVVSVAKWAWGG